MMNLKSIINEKRKDLLRKEIMEEVSGMILDNGSGESGSWNYRSIDNVSAVDKINGGNCEDLKSKFVDCIFDTVVFAGVVQYLDDPNMAIRECYRVLKPSGKLVFASVNINTLFKRFTFWTDEKQIFTLKGLYCLLINNGFEIRKVKFIDFKYIPVNKRMIILIIAKKCKQSGSVKNASKS